VNQGDRIEFFTDNNGAVIIS